MPAFELIVTLAQSAPAMTASTGCSQTDEVIREHLRAARAMRKGC